MTSKTISTTVHGFKFTANDTQLTITATGKITGTSPAAVYAGSMNHSGTLSMQVTAAGEGSCLAVLAGASVDAGLVAYEMTVLVKRVGEHLGVGPRPMPPSVEAV